MYILARRNTIVAVNENNPIYRHTYILKGKHRKEFEACKLICNGLTVTWFQDENRDNVKDAEQELLNIYNALKNGQQFYEIGKQNNKEEKSLDEQIDCAENLLKREIDLWTN